MRHLGTFAYEGEQVEMFRHLKIGMEANVAETGCIFTGIPKRKKIVIGYCWEHLPVASH